MFSFIFNTFFYNPLYNALVALTNIVPNYDLGLATVILTLIVKSFLVPVSHKTIKTQKSLKDLEPEMNRIKETYKHDQQEQAVKIMDLYKQHGVNPFSGVFLVFIQLPIILALFFVFKDGIDLSSTIIYSFVTKPPFISTNLFGLFNLTEKSILLACLVGLTQFLQVQLSLPPIPKKDKNTELSFGDSLNQSLSFQTKYILPFFIMFVSYSLNAAVSIYWIVNNVFTIVHELYVRRSAKSILS